MCRTRHQPGTRRCRRSRLARRRAQTPRSRRGSRIRDDWRPSACETRLSNHPATSECEMRNAESKSSVSDTTNDLSIPHSAFRISSGFRLDWILEHSDWCDRCANQVARLEERPGCRADARWSSGGDDVSRFERDKLRQERDDGGHREDHLSGGGLLLDLTVDRELQRQCLRVRNRVGRENARAHRAEGVMPLAVHPVEELVPLAGLLAGIGFEATVADVVDDRVPGYAA